MLSTALRAYDPATRDTDDHRVAIVPRPDNVPLALTDRPGDFACGHCGLALLRGEPVERLDTDRVVGEDARALLVRCPACGWDNAVPRG